jgi:hypothetical protein
MVATDLDGTIVRPDGSVSPRTVRALRRCTDAGVDVVFVTGRPPRWLAEVSRATGLWGVAVCANGAVVYDVGADSVLAVHPVPVEVIAEAVARMRRALGPVDVALETAEGFELEPTYRTRWDADVVPERKAFLAELLQADPQVLKVLLRAEDRTADAMLATAREVLGDTVTATHSNARDCLLELSAAGVSKAGTLATLAAARGIAAADVIAFGDMPNDVEMLRWAGAGYAMTGGHPEAVAAADHTAPSVLEDGVAQVLERLLEAGVRAPSGSAPSGSAP